MDNKALKSLTKLNMPMLNELIIVETQITVDSVKLLKRRPLNDFKKIGCCRSFETEWVLFKELPYLFQNTDKDSAGEEK